MGATFRFRVSCVGTSTGKFFELLRLIRMESQLAWSGNWCMQAFSTLITMNKLGSNLGDGRTNSEQTLGLVGCFWIVENYINWLKTVKRKRSQIKHRKCNIRQIEISNKSWIQSYHCCSPPHVHRLSSLWRLSLAMLRWCCCLLWAAVVSLQRPGPASWHWPWLRLQHSTSHWLMWAVNCRLVSTAERSVQFVDDIFSWLVS